MVTTAKFTAVNAQVDNTYVSPQSFNDLFAQWSESAECFKIYGSEFNGPALSYQNYVENPMLNINLRRMALNQGDNPLASKQIILDVTRTDSTPADCYCFIFFSQVVKFTRLPTGNYKVDQSIRLLDPAQVKNVV